MIVLNQKEILAIQKQVVDRLYEASSDLKAIRSSRGTVLERWQQMLGIVLPIQYQAAAALGLPADQEGLNAFNSQLMKACSADEELATLNNEKWNFIFRTAFGISSSQSLTVEQARSLIEEIASAMMTDTFLKRVDTQMAAVDAGASMVVKRQRLLEVLLPLHFEVIERHGYNGDAGYLQMQRAILDHYHDPVVTDRSTEAQRLLFARAGLS